MEWTAAIARAVINPRHGVYEAQDGHFMERTHLPLKLHLPASVTIGGCMSKEAIEQKEVIVGKLKDSGCRITKQRLILLDVILEGECGSCKEIYYRASKIDHSIGTATVYRMINTLEEIGAIDRKNMYRVPRYPRPGFMEHPTKMVGCFFLSKNMKKTLDIWMQVRYS